MVSYKKILLSWLGELVLIFGSLTLFSYIQITSEGLRDISVILIGCFLIFTSVILRLAAKEYK